MNMKKRNLALGGLAVLLLAVGLVVALNRMENRPSGEGGRVTADGGRPSAAKPRATVPPVKPRPHAADAESDAESDATESEAEDEPPKTAEELKEAAEEAAVESFDALTDKWMEPSAKGVTMDDVSAFVAQFAKVPENRREECLQRALNLVPDENVMLLAGVLMDKSQPKELVELVFNDVLNRDEDVKKPILRQIYADKKHPCWADTAWILDVTGEAKETK